MNPYWSYILTAVGVFGLWLAGRKNLWGWAVGLGAQGLWIAYAYATNQPGFYLSALAYGSVYARNLHRWTRERREEREAAQRYDKAVSAPMSPEAAAYLNKRLKDGTAPRRKVKRPVQYDFYDDPTWPRPVPGPDSPTQGLGRECQASISGMCLNQTEGFEPCDTDGGECIRKP